MKHKPIEQQTSYSYRPGKVGVAIRRINPPKATLNQRPIPRRLRKLKYNDQLPLPGID